MDCVLALAINDCFQVEAQKGARIGFPPQSISVFSSKHGQLHLFAFAQSRRQKPLRTFAGIVSNNGFRHRSKLMIFPSAAGLATSAD
jgi:hypothetical protein